MLTSKQRDLLLFIHQRILEGGVSPSFDEMRNAVGLQSKSGIHRLIGALEERGFLRRLPNRARALAVIRLPDDATPESGVTNSPQDIVPAIRQSRPAPALGAHMLEIPMLGRIAAGTPIDALRGHQQSIDIPASMVGRGEHYALQVSGDSMIEDGIFDGDTVLIRRSDIADNGQIVVALIDQQEVTLKRLQKKPGQIILIPGNAAHPTRSYPPERVRVQGVLSALLRRYS